jgi:hypothetical protein
LAEALTRNGVAMLTTEESTKRETIETLKTNYKIQNIEELVERGDSIMISTCEWYIPDVVPSYQRNNAMRAKLINVIAKTRRSGLRVVGDGSAMAVYDIRIEIFM